MPSLNDVEVQEQLARAAREICQEAVHEAQVLEVELTKQCRLHALEAVRPQQVAPSSLSAVLLAKAR